MGRIAPLHVVAADNPEEEDTIVITVYEPEPDQWELGVGEETTARLLRMVEGAALEGVQMDIREYIAA